MASRHDAEAAFLEGGSEEATRRSRRRSGLRSERDDSVRAEAGAGESLFESKPLPARLFIMIAGVTMNIVLAFVVAIVHRAALRSARHRDACHRPGAAAA